MFQNSAAVAILATAIAAVAAGAALQILYETTSRQSIWSIKLSLDPLRLTVAAIAGHVNQVLQAASHLPV